MAKFTVTFKRYTGQFDSTTFGGINEAEGFVFDGFSEAEFDLLTPACIVLEEDGFKKLVRVIEPNLVFDEVGAMDIESFSIKGSALVPSWALPR